MKKIIYLNIKIIGLLLVIFSYVFYFRPSRAQQQNPTTSLVQLQVCGAAGACGYGTSLNLGAKTLSYAALIFSGNFSTPFRCEDLNGQTTDWVMTMQSSNLVNQSNSNYIIPADNVELKNTPAHIIGGNCPIDQGTTSWTPIGSMPAVILGKTYSLNQSCKVQADTVSLKVTTLSGQAVGQYSGELTITYSNFDDSIDCRSTVDPNCQRPDTIINYGGAPMKRAGCNSTLGSGIGVHSYSEGTTNYYWNCSGNVSVLPIGDSDLDTGKETSIDSGCKIDNIFGKLYARAPEGAGTGSDLACGFGRHVPSDAERKILEQTYEMDPGIQSNTGLTLYIENYNNDIYGSNGRRGKYQGWKDTAFGLLTRELGFPLAGKLYHIVNSIGGSDRGSVGYYWTQTASGVNARMRQISYNNPKVFRDTVAKTRYQSVRCVRNCPSDFVCAPGERCEVDASCCQHDIKFSYGGTDYSWAGCNSTLGDMIDDPSIFDYTGYAMSCDVISNQIVYNGFNLQEIGIGGACKIKNNFGKLYQRDDNSGHGMRYNCKQSASNNFDGTISNHNCPCPTGRHVPTTFERNKAKDYYTSLGGRNGRDGNQQGLTRQFQLPLAGWCNTTSPLVCISRGYAAHYRSSNENGGNGEAQIIGYSSDTMSNTTKSKYNYLPVRCIKD